MLQLWEEVLHVQELLVQEKIYRKQCGTPKKEMEDEWDAKILCIEKDELAFMAMMGEHINYENDLIIDLEYSNHMIDD